MKKIAIIIICSGLFFAGCLKDKPNVDFSNSSTVVQFINAGPGYFSSDVLTFNSDTLTVPMAINLASVNTLSKDVTVTIGVDAVAANTYNSTSTLKYVIMADSSFSLPKKTITIPAGKRIDTLNISFYKHTLDPSKSYLLAVSITDASGITIASNFQTHYFHVIGNPLSGTYSWDFYRWNDVPDTTGPPNSTVNLGKTFTVLSLDPTTAILPEGYLNANSLGLGGVLLKFTNTNGVISDLSLSIDAATQKAIDDGGFKVITAPALISYQIAGNASNHYAGSMFRFYFEIQNSTGGDRKTINVLTKQ